MAFVKALVYWEKPGKTVLGTRASLFVGGACCVEYVLFFLDATGSSLPACTRVCGMFDGRKGELVTQKMFLVVWKHHARWPPYQ